MHTSEKAGDILVFLTGTSSNCAQCSDNMLSLQNLLINCIHSLTGQSEIERACDILYEKAESIDYRYDVEDQTVEGLLILPLYGSMPTGNWISATAAGFTVIHCEVDEMKLAV